MLRQSALPFVLLSCLAANGLAQQLIVAPEKPGRVYSVMEPIRWSAEVSGPAVKLWYQVSKDGAEPSPRRDMLVTNMERSAIGIWLDQPGTVIVRVSAEVYGKKLSKEVGAAVAPDQIRPSLGCPDDFDAFWKKKIEELHAVPMNARTERVEVDPAVDYFKLQMDNIRGTHVYGQLARPRRAGKFPAMLVVQWAGVYGLDRGFATGPAKEGWLTLNVMPHDLPFDKPKEFYEKAAKGALKDYFRIGCDSRETCYFLRMFLGCYRAADYLVQDPDWDGKTLLVYGVSQGGYQALATAALHAKVTAMIAIAPGGCDITAPLAGRGDSFPYFLSGWPRPANRQAVVETARYFDAVNFAQRIKCPAFVSLGLIDTVCRPTGIYAAYNEIAGPKELLVLPDAPHDGSSFPRCQARVKAWRQALLQGAAVPPRAE